MVNLALGGVASMAAPVALAAAMLTGLSATSKRSLSERMHGFIFLVLLPLSVTFVLMLRRVSATPDETQALIKMLGPNFQDHCVALMD